MLEATSKKINVSPEVEDSLIKAAELVVLQRESKQFSDTFMKEQKDEADKIVEKVFSNMIKEIETIIRR